MCLRKGHVVRECRSRNRCRTGKGRHHRSICQPVTPPSEPLSSPSTTKGLIRATTHLLAKSTSQLNSDAAPFQSLAALVVDEERVILLQTATVALYNPKCPESQMEGTIVFDSGSQQSYVSQAVVECLGLERCGSKVLSIVTFGEEKGRRRQCYVVRIGIRRKHGLQPQELTLLSVSFICGVLPRISRSKLKTRHSQLA